MTAATSLVKARAIRADIDPDDEKKKILDAVSEFVEHIPHVLGARVLLATWIRPDKTAGGIFIPDKTRGEDEYQGKVGLVLKMGDLAFVDDEQHKWKARPKVGDWVLTSIGDTRKLTIGPAACRFVEDVSCQAVISRPDIAW